MSQLQAVDESTTQSSPNPTGEESTASVALQLDRLSEWRATVRPDGSRWLSRGEVSLFISSTIPRPESEYNWRRFELARDIPARASVHELETVDVTTDLGWPMRLVEVQIEAGDQLLEHRLVVFYYFLEYVAVAKVRAPTRQQLEVHRVELVETLKTAWPNWRRGEVASIYDLWQGMNPPGLADESERFEAEGQAASVTWASKIRADGLALFHPRGKQVAAICMRERVAPLQRVADIVAGETKLMKGSFEAIELERCERFLTHEGEFAAMVVISATAKATRDPVRRIIALVYGDETYQRFDAIVQDPSEFDVTREAMAQFARHASLGLGALRWRRFAYAPPSGWQPLVRNLTTEWFPLSYPQQYCRIVVPPAYSRQDCSVVDKAVLRYAEPGFTVAQKDGPHPIDTDVLSGQITRFTGPSENRQLVYEQIVMHDGRFTYVVCLESDEATYARCHELGKQLIDSIEPLPTRLQESRDAIEFMAHWAT